MKARVKFVDADMFLSGDDVMPSKQSKLLAEEMARKVFRRL